MLGVSGTATIGMALWIVFLTITLSDIGISGTLSRFVAAERDPARLNAITSYGARAFAVAMLGGGLLTVLFLLVYWPDILGKYARSRGEAWGFAAIVLACFVVHMLFAFAYQLLRGLRRFDSIARLTLVGTLLQIVLVLIGSHFMGANGALIGYLAFSLPMLWALARVRVTREQPPAEERKRMAVYAGTFYGTALFSPLLWVKADIILVDQFRDGHAVGLFVAASTVAALLMQVSQMVCNALAPNIMHAAADGEAQLHSASRTAVRFGLFVLLPTCAIGAALAPQAIAVVFGAPFAGAGAAAAILCLAVAPSAVTLVSSSVLNATDSNKALVRSGAVGAGLTVVLGVILVWKAGIIGAAVGRLIAQTVVALLNLNALNRRLPGLVSLEWLGPILFSSLAAGLAGLAVGQVGLGLLAAVLGLVVAGGTYVALVVLTMRMGSDELAAATRIVAPLSPGPRKLAHLVIGWFAGKQEGSDTVAPRVDPGPL
ncbi:MAG: polysaccharide biosynthesis C-terminal domain-containing protein [Rhizorhabdus sp.]